MACEGSALARVYFRQANGSWDNIVSRHPPVTATTEQVKEPYKCPAPYLIRIQYGVIYRPFGSTAGGTDTAVEYGPFTGPPFIDCVDNLRAIYITSTNPMYPVGGQKIRLTSGYSPCSNWDMDPDFKVLIFRRYDGLPDDCGTNRCKLTVSDASGQLYSRVDDVCPDVDIKCEGDCPPGYCKCFKPNRRDFCCCRCSRSSG